MQGIVNSRLNMFIYAELGSVYLYGQGISKTTFTPAFVTTPKFSNSCYTLLPISDKYLPTDFDSSCTFHLISSGCVPKRVLDKPSVAVLIVSILNTNSVKSKVKRFWISGCGPQKLNSYIMDTLFPLGPGSFDSSIPDCWAQWACQTSCSAKNCSCTRWHTLLRTPKHRLVGDFWLACKFGLPFQTLIFGLKQMLLLYLFAFLHFPLLLKSNWAEDGTEPIVQLRLWSEKLIKP